VLLPGAKRVLYLDAVKAGHFDVRAAEKIEGYVGKSQRWKEKKGASVSSDFPVGKLFLLAAGACLTVLVLWALIRQPEPSKKPEEAPGAAKIQADRLLKLLRSKDYDQAYGALSPSMGVSREGFAKTLMDWAEDDKNRWDLHHRVTQGESKGVVVITGPPGSSDWRWTFSFDGSSWKLCDSYGGPIEPARAPAGSPSP
jgi:hypothetical protein